MSFSNTGKFGWRTEKLRWKPTVPRLSWIANHDGSTSVHFSKYKLSGHLIKCRGAELDGDWTSFPRTRTPTHARAHTPSTSLSLSLSVLSFLLHSNILTHSSNKEHLTLDFYSAANHRVQYNLINISRMHKHTRAHTHTHARACLHGGGRSTGPIYLRNVALRSPGPKS